jgi:quercetin dioxygenase-like cupin family protein
MAETTFLAGKVRKQSLPVLTGGSGPDVPLLKRLMLAQGELAQFHDDNEGMRYIALIELLPAQVRGNHYHRQKQERIYVMRGELMLLVEDTATGARCSVPLRAGDLAAIAPGVAHAIQPVTAGLAVEFAPERFDAADTVRFAVADGGTIRSP